MNYPSRVRVIIKEGFSIIKVTLVIHMGITAKQCDSSVGIGGIATSTIKIRQMNQFVDTSNSNFDNEFDVFWCCSF